MIKYTLRVRDFAVQAANLTSEPNLTGSAQTPTVDDPRNPTRVTVYTTTGAAAALRIAQRHLNLVHARLAYNNPDSVTRTATDTVYAEARSRAETLTPEQRRDESFHTLHSDDDALRMDALNDVMEELGELDA
ncbi:hypothetical protein AB0A60_33625 [Streptomyces sp. NPDC046275]|uniref:hypothetical protein n=1 Tax=Streptomyces sp. NPDC046275 TaxID=3157201 RepID=UPI00340D28AD